LSHLIEKLILYYSKMHFHFHPYIPTIVLLCLAALAMMIQGTWNIDIAHNWVFICVMIAMLGIACWQVFHSRKKFRSGDMLCHAGFVLLVVGILAGWPWNENGKAVVTYDTPTRIIYATDRQPLAMPFELKLSDFHIDYYNDGEHVQQYRAILRVLDLTYSDTLYHYVTSSVNHPAKYLDYNLYMDSYDVENEQYVVIKIVKEPLMPLIYIAMALLALGAILQIPAHWRGQTVWLWAGAIVLAVGFTALSVLRIHFGYLMPALRSGWFVPHLAFYMLAYSLLAISLVMAIIKNRVSEPHKLSNTISSLLHTSSSLLLLGMLCGAVWAKQAWGDYWTWDPKECWAAATWFLSLAAVHSTRSHHSKKRAKVRLVMMILCFLAMQVTWYGVNYLPSAKDSLHTYNSKS